MVHRIALLIGAVAAMAVLAAGVVAAGSGPSRAVFTDVSKAVDQTTAASTQTVTDTVYIRPAPPREVIHITRQDKAEAPAPRTNGTRHSRHGGDDEDEGHDDDRDGRGGGDDGPGGDD